MGIHIWCTCEDTHTPTHTYMYTCVCRCMCLCAYVYALLFGTLWYCVTHKMISAFYIVIVWVDYIIFFFSSLYIEVVDVVPAQSIDLCLQLAVPQDQTVIFLVAIEYNIALCTKFEQLRTLIILYIVISKDVFIDNKYITYTRIMCYLHVLSVFLLVNNLQHLIRISVIYHVDNTGCKTHNKTPWEVITCKRYIFN